MSRDTKTRRTDCQGHSEASIVPFTSPYPIDAKRDEPSESDHRQGSVRSVTSSVATICASETDEGDYETSSEGMISSKRSGTEIRGARAKESLCVYFKEKSISLSKLATFDRNVSPIKEELTPDLPHDLMENRLTQKTTYVRDSLKSVPENLAKSKSLPILKNEIPNNISMNFKATDVTLMSASSFARKKKMSMIVKRMASLISSYPSTVSLTTGVPATNFRDQRYEMGRLEPRTMLPGATPTAVINDGRSEEFVAEVTFRETRNNHPTMDWNPSRDVTPAFVNDEGAANLTNDGDLVDVARNSYSSVKSVYFPPNAPDLRSPVLPGDSAKSERRQWSTDVAALLKIDNELGPLRYQYSEIIGKTRALGLNGMAFDLGVSCRPDPSETFVNRSVVLSPNGSDYFLDRGRTFPRRVTTSRSIENRPVLVDNTSPSPTFSMVGKSTPRGSRTSWLNVNDSDRRQEALSFVIRDLSRTLESLDDLRSSGRIRNSTSHLPATDSRASRRKNILGERFCNGCVSNNDFRPYREPKVERATSAWAGWSLHGRFDTSPSSILNKTEYNSHRYLNRTVENSRTRSNFIEVRKQESSVSTVVRVIDNNWDIDEEAANKLSNQHVEIFSDDRNSTTVRAKFVTDRDSNHHKNVLAEIERVVENDRISSPFECKSIERSAGPDRQIPRTVSTSARSPRFRVVSVNTEFRATVEKHYTSRAVSPVRQPRSTTVSSTTMPSSNVLFAAKMSGIFMQQVRADSSIEAAKIEPSSEIRSVDVNKEDDIAHATNKRDFCAQKVDSRSTTEDLSRLVGSKKDEIDPTMTERKNMRHPCLSGTKEKITIVPIVLTDDVSESSRIADVNVAIPRYADKRVPKLSYQIVPFETRKSRWISLSSNRDNETYRRDIADSACLTEEFFANEKRWKAGETSVSRVSHSRLYTREDNALSTTDDDVARDPKRSARIAISRLRPGEDTREYRDSDGQRIAKTIPGMRSSPEDFLCET